MAVDSCSLKYRQIRKCVAAKLPHPYLYSRSPQPKAQSPPHLNNQDYSVHNTSRKAEKHNSVSHRLLLQKAIVQS